MYKRRIRVIEFILVDIIIILFTYWYGFNYAHDINVFASDIWALKFIIIISITIFVNFLFNLYKLVLDFVGIYEFIKILTSTVISNILIYITFMIWDISIFPFKLLIFIISIESLLFVASRFLKRLLIGAGILYGNRRKNLSNLVKTLVIGAGSGAKLVLDEINSNVNLNNKVVLFLDDDEEKIGKQLNGIPIYGPISEAPSYIDRFQIKEVIIAIASLDTERLRDLIKVIEEKNVKIKRLPLMTEVSLDTQRKIMDVKIEDLLSRGVIDLNNDGLNEFIFGKTILVTGGGGSIGSELCHQIITYKPEKLIIFDIYENTTYNVQLELLKRIENKELNIELVVLIGSVYNYKRIETVFKIHQPDIVFHAAAYKHVPLMEDSAVEAVRTNVFGTYNVAHLADKYNLEKMVLVSTDKAVRPTNIMGATKSCCEKIIQYFAGKSDTSYSAVRFGNVLGSHGSVVPLFKKQIAAGGPVTVTHREITRYFMTIPEAVSLILQSGVYSKGGEIFILDMGKPVKIFDLAQRMIKLSGFVPNKDIKIVEVGLRPGEKLYEELLLDRNRHMRTENDKIFVESNGNHYLKLEDFINDLRNVFEDATNHEIKKHIQKLITDYIIYEAPDNNEE